MLVQQVSLAVRTSLRAASANCMRKKLGEMRRGALDLTSSQKFAEHSSDEPRTAVLANLVSHS